MRPLYLAIGLALIIAGAALIALYGVVIKPERDARALITESTLIMEKGDKESIAQGINTLRTIFVRYPNTNAVPQAYFLTAQAYERLGLFRIAYIKYGYLLRKPLSEKTDERLRNEAAIKMNKIRILRNYSEEGVHNLYGMLGTAQNPDLRSKVYAELGQAYLRGGDTKRARSSFDIALQENSSNEEALIGKARSLKRSGRDEEAYIVYDYFLKYYGAVSPYTTDVRNAYMSELYDSGIRSFRAGSHYKAIDYFNKFVTIFGGTRLSENAYYWAGESYYSLRKFDSSVKYFDRALSNGFYHKDEDARIKKGYAYFMASRYGNAAQEFQKYLHDFPRGKYSNDAKRWKEMSTQNIPAKEPLLPPEDFDIEKMKKPEKKDRSSLDEKDASDKVEPQGDSDDNGKDQPKDEESKDNPYGNEEVGGSYDIETDNIAEM